MHLAFEGWIESRRAELTEKGVSITFRFSSKTLLEVAEPVEHPMSVADFESGERFGTIAIGQQGWCDIDFLDRETDEVYAEYHDIESVQQLDALMTDFTQKLTSAGKRK